MIVLLLGEILHFMLIFICFEGCYDFTAKILSRSSSQFSLFHYFHTGLFGFRHYIMDSSSLPHLGPYNAFKDVPLKRYIFFVFSITCCRNIPWPHLPTDTALLSNHLKQRIQLF